MRKRSRHQHAHPTANPERVRPVPDVTITVVLQGGPCDGARYQVNAAAFTRLRGQLDVEAPDLSRATYRVLLHDGRTLVHDHTGALVLRHLP